MLQAVHNYIQNKYGEHTFSELFYQAGDTATGKAVASFDQRPARAVLLHYIYWLNVAPAVVPVALTWKDNFGAVIFTQLNVNTTGWAPIPLVVNNPKLNISCSSLTQVWSISFQYIV